MDIGSAVSRASGITDDELAAIGHYQESEVFSHLDKLVLDLATQMTRTPADVDPSLRESLLGYLSRAQLTELVATISWENQRARLNRALGVREAGFSDGAYCVLPSRD